MSWMDKDISFYGGGGHGGESNGDRLKISNFTTDVQYAEEGVSLETLTFSWVITGGILTAQNISPLVGDVPVSQRTVTINSQNITANTVFSLTVVGEESTKIAVTEVKFVNPIYIGLVNAAVPGESDLLAMIKRVGAAESFVYTSAINDQRTAIAVPKSMDTLKDIQDSTMGLSLLGDFDIIDGISLTTAAGAQLYTVYVFKTLQNTLGLNQSIRLVW